jgi:hypothetical protein
MEIQMDQTATFGTVIAVSESSNGVESSVKLQLRLVNTLGQKMEVWVLAPPEVVNFFAPETGMPVGAG